MFWYVFPFFILAYDSASTATRSPSAVTPLAVSRSPPSILEASAPATSANCALVFVPERAKLPATHHVAESASTPNAAAPLPALIFSMKPSTIFLFSSTPIMLTSRCRFVGPTSATYCRSSCTCKRAGGVLFTPPARLLSKLQLVLRVLRSRLRPRDRGKQLTLAPPRG